MSQAVSGGVVNFETKVAQEQLHPIFEDDRWPRARIKGGETKLGSTSMGFPKGQIGWMESDLDRWISLGYLGCPSEMIKVSVCQPNLCDLPIAVIGFLYEKIAIPSWINNYSVIVCWIGYQVGVGHSWTQGIGSDLEMVFFRVVFH